MHCYKSLQHKRKQPAKVKVAVIDNGVDHFSFKQGIADGISFAYHNNGDESNWWLASDPHGTQMAKVLRHTDPYCELFIAKVGNHKKDITAERVVQV